MKRTLAILISIIMLFTLIPATAFAEGTEGCQCKEPEINEWNYWKYSAGENSDCTDPGQIFMRGGWCQVCKQYFSETIPTQPSHIFDALPMYDIDGKIIEENYKEPTCDENGFAAYECRICSTRYEQPIAALGHTYGDAVIYKKCFSDGTAVNGLYRKYCTKPGCDSYEEERIVNHRCAVYEGVEASCFTDGRTAYVYCFDCNTESPSVTTPRLEHVDADSNGKCDLCFSDYISDGVYCSCICHSDNAFMKILMPLFRLIWQLLGVDNCHGNCEAVHYE